MPVRASVQKYAVSLLIFIAFHFIILHFIHDSLNQKVISSFRQEKRQKKMTKRHHLIIMAFVTIIPNESQAGQVRAGPKQNDINIC